jgi:hypothetical protein
MDSAASSNTSSAILPYFADQSAFPFFFKESNVSLFKRLFISNELILRIDNQ